MVKSFITEVNVSMERPNELVECGAACAKDELCNAVRWDKLNQRCSFVNVSNSTRKDESSGT